ncbi:vegetative incompatibility protein HET-E-1, partial [Mycena rebaudengoi]
MDIWDSSQEQRQDNETVKRDKIIKWMSPLNPFRRHKDIFGTHQGGTGQWLLADVGFTTWKESIGGTLWCHGIPGAGKTVLSSVVVDYLQAQFQPSENIGVACIYLNHKEGDLQSQENLLASLWWQLIVDKSLGTSVHKLHEHHRGRQTRPSVQEIDAMHTLEIRATEDDIRQYVDGHIQMSPRLSRHIQSRPELRQEIETKILSNVEGMFLLAKLHVESLATKITVKSLREALTNLPKDLEHTYNEAIERIESQTEEDRNLAFLTLTWVANAKRPLTIAELQEAIAIEVDSKSLDPDSILDITYIVGVCGGLVVIDLADGQVRLIHYTTQGYLDSVQATKFPWAQTKITQACLTYLSFETFQDLPSSWKGANVHAQGGLFGNALQAASVKGHESIVHLLIEKGANVHAQGGLFGNALQAASYGGHESIVHLLIEKGLDVHAQGGSYGNALQAASYGGHESTVHLLIEKGANVHAQGGYYGNALQAASYGGHESTVHLLIEKGANVHAQGGYYGNALQAASDLGHESIVHQLIKKGADVNAQGGHFGNALQAASFQGYESIVHLLIEKGADVNAQGGEYGNVLQAASYGGHESIVHLLIEKGADVNVQGGRFGNALQAASCSGHESIVHLLIEKGANVNAQGGLFGNALQAASFSGHESIFHLLIEKGANVHAQGGHFGNALQAASHGGHELIVHLLIEKGANVHAQGGFFGNVLQAASYGGHESIVHLLIEKGAN